ncbi:MAG TPA: hypothetical protein VM266_08130 [Solirubrobacteraceae bacterium]|nr:hypothetical protein [Solirubrobacteraceae bacterium]
MGLLDDAIREHLELKKRSGAPEEEVQRLESEAFGPARSAAVPPPAEAPTADPEPEPASEPEPEPVAAEPAPAPDPPPAPAPAPPREPEAWLEDEPEVTRELPAADQTGAAAGEDLLEETPEFLQETPEHDRLWFEQRPPRDFDFDS